MSKISIRFFKDYKVRAVWDDEHNQWWFSVLDIVGAINQQDSVLISKFCIGKIGHFNKREKENGLAHEI